MRRFHETVFILMMVTLLTGSTIFCEPVQAGRSSWEAGVRGGWSFNDEDESFSQIDLFVNYGLPWSWLWGSAVQVDTQLTAAIGILDGAGDEGVAGSLGFEFVFGSSSGKCPFQLRAGSALTLISQDEYGDEDLGGPLQFTHNISLYYWLLENLSTVARVQHMSNADLYSENPGVNMVMLSLVYRF